jgi:hypothetical protein
MPRVSIDPASLYTLKRAVVRLVIILVFAFVQWETPWGFSKALQLLLAFNALICTAIAAYKRESAVSRSLGHWDEAAFLFLLCVAVHLLVRTH